MKTKRISNTWRYCKYQQPSEDGEYMCIVASGYITTICYNTKHNMWNVTDDDTHTDMTDRIVAWADHKKMVEHLMEGVQE